MMMHDWIQYIEQRNPEDIRFRDAAAYARAAVLEEREQCAQLAETYQNAISSQGPYNIAKMIRARSEP